MTLHELVEVLTDLAETDGEREVRVAHQPSYPLSASLQTVSMVDGVIWLAAAEAFEYAPSAAWDGDLDA